MKKFYRKNFIFLIAVAVALGSGLSSMAFGAPSHGIKYTPHNLSTTNKMGASLHDPVAMNSQGQFHHLSETEICIFCHTPHNAVPGQRFLWNRTNSITTFMMYTGSPTLDFVTKPTTPSPVSKMCLSCHDGATALNAMANPRGTQTANQMNGLADQIGDIYYPSGLCNGSISCMANIGGAEVLNPSHPTDNSLDPAYPGSGGLLVDDHPISFIYAQSASYDKTIISANGPGGSSIGGLPLWWDNGGYRLECVTCHDPHINYNTNYGGDIGYMPFLRKKNYSSSLCFTCHNK